MARSLLVLALVAAAYVAAVQAQVPGIEVVIQFDNTLSRVQGNIKTVNKYVAEKLCRVDGKNVVAMKGKDESSTFNHQSKVIFFCAGKDTKALVSNCNGMWNRHQVKDEIKDHTTPDIEVDKVISCTPTTFTAGRKLML